MKIKYQGRAVKLLMHQSWKLQFENCRCQRISHLIMPIKSKFQLQNSISWYLREWLWEDLDICIGLKNFYWWVWNYGPWDGHRCQKFWSEAKTWAVGPNTSFLGPKHNFYSWLLMDLGSWNFACSHHFWLPNRKACHHCGWWKFI